MLVLRNSLLSIVLTVMVVLLHGTEAKRCRFVASDSPTSATTGSTTAAASENYSATSGTPTQAASTGTETGTASTTKYGGTSSANSTTTSSSGGKRGLAWAVDNKYATTLGAGDISWYYHWQEGPVSGMPSNIPYVPQLWGTSKLSQWQTVMQGLTKLPEYLLSFNEPDLSSQGNMSPQAAASAYKQYIHPYAAKGVKIGAPCISWDTNWYQSFFDACDGCHFDFLCMHSYMPYTGAESLKSSVENVHNKFSKYANELWVNEYGVTSASGGSEAQVMSFMKETTSWLESQSYIGKIAWFGAWNSNPDGYASDYCSLINSGGQLTQAGQYYIN